MHGSYHSTEDSFCQLIQDKKSIKLLLKSAINR
jgi:hypothetical protein